MKKPTTTMKRKSAKEATGGDSPSQLINARVDALSDGRGEPLARVRSLIREADPEMVEEVKWRKPSNSMLGGSGVVARRQHLYRRDLQDHREAALRQRRLDRGPFAPLQREPRRQCEARHRYP